jgi:hypothetical protein
MTTHAFTYECRCGEKSPRFDSREKARAWHGRHKREDCVGSDAELAERLAWARSFEPMPAPEPSDAGPRVAYYAVGNSRFGAIRRVVIPEPIERDSWGAKIR